MSSSVSRSLRKHGKELAKLLRESSFEGVKEIIEIILNDVDSAPKDESMASECVERLAKKLESVLQDFTDEPGCEDLAKKVGNLYSIHPSTIITEPANPSEHCDAFSERLADAASLNEKELDAVENAYKQLLDDTEKKCLDCFFLFPSGAEIKKREIIHCWIAMEYLCENSEDPAAYQSLDHHRILAKLVDVGLIERSIKHKKLHNRYKMPTSVRSRLNTIQRTSVTQSRYGCRYIQNKSQEQPRPNLPNRLATRLMTFKRTVSSISNDLIVPGNTNIVPAPDQDDSAPPLAGQTTIASPLLALDQTGNRQATPEQTNSPAPAPAPAPPEAEYIAGLLNVNLTSINVKRLESIIKLKNLKMLHLGNWQQNEDAYIVIEDPDNLSKMSQVRFLSLEGVTGIVHLPAYIYDLKKLKVLDVRACPNLEFLSKDIGKLHNLTHLDLSECYLLDHVPKEITALANLQVLKGFVATLANHLPAAKKSKWVIGKRNKAKNTIPCLFRDLKELKKLRKLSIRTRRMDFPTEQDFETLSEMKGLKSLGISWVGNSRVDPSNVCEGKFPTSLAKLELQAAPEQTASQLLSQISKDTENYNLEKVYIRGGDLQELKDTFLHVKVLRLRYLPKLRIDWNTIDSLFPALGRLEIRDCPNLSFFSCVKNFVWEKV